MRTQVARYLTNSRVRFFVNKSAYKEVMVVFLKNTFKNDGVSFHCSFFSPELQGSERVLKIELNEVAKTWNETTFAELPVEIQAYAIKRDYLLSQESDGMS